MGQFLPPPGTLSIPSLAEVMGVHANSVYNALRNRRGPRLTPVEPSPTTHYEGQRRDHCVTFDDAIDWLLTYRGRKDYESAILTLRARRAIYRAFNPEPPRKERKRNSEAGGIPTASFAIGGLEP